MMDHPHRILAILAVVVPMTLSPGCDRHERQLERADRSRLEGDLEGALELYRKASVSEDGDIAGPALLAAAEIVRQQGGEDRRVEELCQEGTDRFPGTASAGTCLRLVAEACEARGDPWGAIDALRLFLEQRHDDPAAEEVRHRVAQLYLDLDDPAQARLEWNEQLEHHPEGRLAAAALLGVARSHDVAGDCALAIPAYRKVQSRHPTTPQAAEAMVGEAGCLEAADDLDAAERLYRRAQPLHPNPEMVLQRLDDLERSRWVRDPPSR